ncbi:MAG: CBS domain-containing protein [Candidatus Nanoarchaeia archaeon]
MYAPTELKSIRQSLGITQKQLANLSDVSQSLIAKIESGRTDPSYTSMNKLSNALEQCRKKEQKTVQQVMTKKVVSCTPSTHIGDAIDILKKHKISQMPVMGHNRVHGFISESTILNALLENKNKKTKIDDIMEDSQPIIAKTTTLDVASHLLQFHSMLLISDKDKITGVLTRSDILGKL